MAKQNIDASNLRRIFLSSADQFAEGRAAARLERNAAAPEGATQRAGSIDPRRYSWSKRR